MLTLAIETPRLRLRRFAREALAAWIDSLCASAEVEAFLAVTDLRDLASRALLTRLGFDLHEEREAEYFGEPRVDEYYMLRPAPPTGSSPRTPQSRTRARPERVPGVHVGLTA